jgi:YHS domain-containing protein
VIPLKKENIVEKLKKVTLLALMFLFAAGTVLVTHLPVQAKPQTTCPVLGGTINKEVYADYQGKRIYFCCQGCDKEFEKNPEKYLQKLKDEGVTLEPAPAAKGKEGK